MPTGAEEVTTVAVVAAGFAKLLDTAANAVQGVDVLVGWAKAQEGVSYNSHVFAFPDKEEAAADKEGEGPGEKKKESASAAAPRARKADPVSVSSAPIIFRPNGLIRSFLFVVATGQDLTAGKVPEVEMQVGSGLLQFGIALRQSSEPLYDNGQVILLNARGFDTALGSQAAFEFSGQSWSGRYLLTFSGQINPLGKGFRRIAGGVIVDPRGELQPYGSWETGDEDSAPTSREFKDNLPWEKGLGLLVRV